ncbi:kita-kyushu lung cancer antigen 1 [Sorex araneus]|uniref:kita-kyushu lung cancer antigen 1 n=1 Tax=Sorex araneus TaxID=42254 RepID=UPI0003317340|nr:kita-kyushu lung cancer antigen 1 [Sorex araneus]
MNFFLLLMGTFMGATIVIWFKNKFQRNIPRRSSLSLLTSLAPVRSSSPAASNRRSDNKDLSVERNFQNRIKKTPQSLATLMKTLVNLRILEFKLAELEHLIAGMTLNVASLNQSESESSENFLECTSSAGRN